MSKINIIPLVFANGKKLGQIERLNDGIKFHSFARIDNNGISSFYRINREFKDEAELISYLDGANIGFGLPGNRNKPKYLSLNDCYFKGFPNGFIEGERF